MRASAQSCYAVGDTLPSVIRLANHPALVCFASETSCAIVHESITNMASWVAKRCGSVRLVLATDDTSAAFRMAETYGWTFPVDVDVTGAIHAGFGIELSRYYYLVDEDNVIRAAGPIGSGRHDFMETVRVLDTLCASKRTSVTPSLIVTDSFTIKVNGKPIYPSLQRQVAVLDSGRKVVIGLLPEQQVLFLNERYECDSAIDVKNLVPWDPVMPMFASNSILDTVFSILDRSDQDASMRSQLFSAGGQPLSEDTLQLVTFSMRPWLMPHRMRDGRFVVPLTGASSGQPFAVYNPDSEWTSLFGRATYPHDRYRLSGYSFQYIAEDGEGGFYSLSGLSDTVLHILREQQKGQPVPVRFDTSIWRTAWRQELPSDPGVIDVEVQRLLQRHTSTLMGLLFDHAKQELWVVFGNADALGSGYAFFVTGPIGSTTQRTLAAPDGVLPAAVHNGRFHGTRVGPDGLEYVVSEVGE